MKSPILNFGLNHIACIENESFVRLCYGRQNIKRCASDKRDFFEESHRITHPKSLPLKQLCSITDEGVQLLFAFGGSAPSSMTMHTMVMNTRSNHFREFLHTADSVPFSFPLVKIMCPFWRVRTKPVLSKEYELILVDNEGKVWEMKLISKIFRSQKIMALERIRISKGAPLSKDVYIDRPSATSKSRQGDDDFIFLLDKDDFLWLKHCRFRSSLPVPLSLSLLVSNDDKNHDGGCSVPDSEIDSGWWIKLKPERKVEILSFSPSPLISLIDDDNENTSGGTGNTAMRECFSSLEVVSKDRGMIFYIAPPSRKGVTTRSSSAVNRCIQNHQRAFTKVPRTVQIRDPLFSHSGCIQTREGRIFHILNHKDGGSSSFPKTKKTNTPPLFVKEYSFERLIIIDDDDGGGSGSGGTNIARRTKGAVKSLRFFKGDSCSFHHLVFDEKDKSISVILFPVNLSNGNANGDDLNEDEDACVISPLDFYPSSSSPLPLIDGH